MQVLVSPTTLLALCSDNASLLALPKISPSQVSGPEAFSSGQIAERLLALLTSSAVRKGSLEQMQIERCSPDLLRAIDRCVRADKSVQLTLMAFPFKVPNPAKVGRRRLPDLAELAALVRLHQLNVKAKSIYPPGLEIHVIHDGSYIASVFRVTLQEVRCYESYFARLVRAVGMGQLIRVHDFESLLAPCISDPRQEAARLRESTLNWWSSFQDTEEWKDRFSKTLGMINLRSLPMSEACRLLDHGASGRLPPEYRDLEQRVHVAMRRYHERDSLLHARDPRSVCFPDAIHLTTQCRPYRLAIWMVSRGCSLLPWHGVGVVDRRGEWGVALAREVLGDPSYHPVFLEGEDTPFFYRQVG
jgi:hypothetical protein